jgi:clan AA aspartic protease (TIGR02281 family)
MPVIGLIVVLIIIAAFIGIAGSLLIFVVLPAAVLGLCIWLGVYLYQQDQASQEQARIEQKTREELQAVEQLKLEEVRKQEELLRIADQSQKADAVLAHSYGERAGKIYQELLPTGSGQFSVQLSQLPLANTIVAKMADVFWEKELVDRNIGGDVRDRLRHGAESIGTKDNPVWPQNYKGKDPHKVYFPKEYWQMFDAWVPFSFSDRDRFTHHWCLGHNGTGKTTFLRHFIAHDLDRVLAGECSLIVMDSKKLIREMRMLTTFHPSNPLHDKLTLIDADEPFPLNPFCLPKAQARSVISYMLANLSAASELQTGALAFLIDGALAANKPTLRTIRNFFTLKISKGELAELPENFDKMDEDTQFWFKNTFSKLHPATREGIQQRLTNFMKQNELLDRMISADSFGLSMPLLGRGGRVLLVDTNLAKFGEEGANVFGRLIIALINQLSSQRSEQDEQKLKPVFVYVDEAQDYIKQDAMFANILEKARAQKIAMTVAHHHKGQIDPRIEASLENAGIKSECHDIGSVTVKTRRETMTLPIGKLEFNDPAWKMTDGDYRKLRRRLQAHYPYRNDAALGLATPRFVTIASDTRGHFIVSALVNGIEISLMVDTGASFVNLTYETAEKLGLRPHDSAFTVQVQTANGVTQCAPIHLSTMVVEGLSVDNVSTLVSRRGSTNENLLGMSFLSRLRRFEFGDGRLVLEPYTDEPLTQKF